VNILLVSATEAELAGIYQLAGIPEGTSSFDAGRHHIQTLICGIGPAQASFACGRTLALCQYDLVINLGIAGAIDPEITPGQAVAVSCDRFFMLGSEDKTAFLSVFDLGLSNPDQPPYRAGMIHAHAEMMHLLPEKTACVEGITAMCVHGNETSIELLRKIYPDAAVESQEGAAVMLAATLSGIPCMQLRGISNRVEPRNRENWQIGAAVSAVGVLLKAFLDRLPAA
jgi:futalosine hydrolase